MALSHAGFAPIRYGAPNRVERPPSLHSILIFVPDVDVGRAFYRDVLGFSVTSATDSHIAMKGAGFNLSLFRCDSQGSPDGYSSRAGSSVAFSVRSLEESMARFKSQGVQFLHDEPSDGPSGRYVAFLDPFGTVHELVESRSAPNRGAS